MIERKSGYHIIADNKKRLNKCRSNKRAIQLANKAREAGYKITLVFDDLNLTEDALLEKHRD